MVDPNAGKFISSLVKSLQMLCHGYMEFNDNIEIIGHINVRIDNGQKMDYIVNEQVLKHGQESTFFQSNSYHSLPPGKSSLSDRERLSSGRCEDGYGVNHRLDSPVAALGGTCLQVDLSGPVPVTRSTYASSPDGFFGATCSRQRRSNSRDSQVLPGEQMSSLIVPDHPQTHGGEASQGGGEADRGEMGVASDGSARAEAGEGETQNCGSVPQGLDLCQGVVIKAEPVDDAFPSAMEESGRTSKAADSCSTSKVSAAHVSGQSMASATHPVTMVTLPLSIDGEPPPSKAEGPDPESKDKEGVLPADRSPAPSTSQAFVPAIFTPQPGLAVITGTLKAELVSAAKRLSASALSSSSQKNCRSAELSGKGTDYSFSVLSSSSPGVKKRKMEEVRCLVCGTHFRNNRLLGMHIRLVHRKKARSKGASLSTLLDEVDAFTPSASALVSDGARRQEVELGKSAGLHIATESFLQLAKTKSAGADPPRLLQVDSRAASSKTGPAACQFCQILFWNKQDLLDHQKLCAQKYRDGATPSVCPVCQLVFADAAALAEHQQTCCGGEQSGAGVTNPNTCPLCLMPFTDPALLSAHLWVCGKADTSAESSTSAAESVTAVASSTTVLTTTTTTTSGGGSSSNTTITTTTTTSGSNNTCDHCGKVFQGRTSLVDHINSMHRGMSFTCPDCGDKFKWRTCVYRHKVRCRRAKNAA